MSIASVQFQLIDPGKVAPWIGQNKSLYRLGWLWFDYDGYGGPLHYIRYPQQIFFPENRLATGFNWQYSDNGVKGNFQITYSKLNELPVDVITNGVGLGVGQVAGLGTLSETGILTPPAAPAKLGSNQRLRGYISN